MVIAEQMEERDRAQRARQEKLEQMGTGGRRRDRQAAPLQKATRPRTARHKIDVVRLASLSAPRHPKTLPKEELSPFPLAPRLDPVSMDRIPSAPTMRNLPAMDEAETLWSLGPSATQPLTVERPASRSHAQTQLPSLITGTGAGSPTNGRSPEDLRRVVYSRSLSNMRPVTSPVRRHPPPASQWPAVRYK